jgi:hypothetical protein
MDNFPASSRRPLMGATGIKACEQVRYICMAFLCQNKDYREIITDNDHKVLECVDMRLTKTTIELLCPSDSARYESNRHSAPTEHSVRG